jgi:hypothetical protein
MSDADRPSGGSASHKNDITYSTAVATPHVAWAKKLRGGPIRGFFIPSVTNGRDMVELMQRLDLQPTTVTIDRDWDTNCWGIGDYYDHENRGDRDDFRIEYGYVERDLTGPAPFDVIIIPGLNGWSRMTRPARDAILRRVHEGAGLVLIHPFVGDVENHPFADDEKTGDTRLWDISPLVDCPNDRVAGDGYPELNKDAITTGKWEITGDHYITRGVPAALLPEAVLGGSFYKYRATGDVLIKSGDHPILAVKPYGKGRVVALGYVEQGFLPESVDPIDTGVHWDYWEYEYSLLARAIVWASGRDSGVEVRGFGPGQMGGDATAMPGSPWPRGGTVSVQLAAPGHAAGPATVEVTGKTQYGQPLTPYRKQVELQAGGMQSVEIPVASLMPSTGWPQGKLIFNVIVRDASGTTLDWSAATFDAPRHATLAEVKPGSDLYKRGDTLHAAVRVEGSLNGLHLWFSVLDDYDRVLTRQEHPAASHTEFDYRLTDFIGKFASVRVDLVDAHGFIVDRREAKPLLVIPDQRRAREYVASIGFSSLRPNFRSVRLRQIRAASADIGMTWTEGVNNGLEVPRDSFGIYWYHRGPEDQAGLDKVIQEYQRTGNYAALPYNARRELYKRTHDKKMLVRTPSFSDPAFMTRLRDGVFKSAQEKARYGLDYYFVGDEGSITSYGDAFDYSWDDYTLADFRTWLKTQYGSLDALNAEWKTSFQSWDAVVPYTTEEARQANNYAPWADHRTFMEIQFAGTYQAVRDAVTKGDPRGHIALSGTQETTAYNGCDWYRLDQVIDDFLSYDGGNQWDMHRSFAKPGAMLGFWTGYGSHGLGVQNAIWNAAIHDVLYPQIFWLASFLNPDFTHSKSARDMGEAFHALRYEGIGKLFMESERLQDGIAIHYSMPSVHAAVHLLRPKKEGEQTPQFDASRDGWVHTINGLGMQFNFVAGPQVEAGALASGNYRVLILPLSAALSPREVKEIEAFAERGGIVIADTAAGVMDDHCAWVQNGALNAFFGIATEPSDQRDFTRLSGPVTATDTGKAWGVGAAASGDLSVVEPVTATTSVPLLRVGGHDAVFVRQVGKGWAIYLNATLDGNGNGRARRRSNGGPAGDLVGALLNHLGMHPAVRVLDADGKPLTHAQVVRYRYGDAEALAIVTENVGVKAIQGRDGVKVYQDANLGEVASQEVTIHLPQRVHVTDIRTGKRLGTTDTVKTSITIGGVLVLGLSRADNRIALSGPESARLGAHVSFRVASTGSSKSLVRCHVLGPGGQFRAEYARNLVVGQGGAAFVLPSALNDAPGTYTVRATDVITGATSELHLTLAH